mmetsp:Transcript_41640/g.93959  ORF Transcript_41640/g.93959 Transcript_41640/m.93959 type:complete len:388 (+) Transcript_41640:229-1392(+)
MTRKESIPRAASRRHVPWHAARRLGNQRDSRVSVSRKTRSCVWKASSSQATASLASSSSAPAMRACPGMGIVSAKPSAATPGKMRLSAAAAHAALGFPPPSQSANSKSDCRVGLEKLTVPLSTSVKLRTPQPSRVRLTAQPSVPAPRRSTLHAASLSVSRLGRARHRMRRRLRSAEASASLRGSISAARSMRRAPGLPRAFASHPTAPTLGSSPPAVSAFPAPGSAAGVEAARVVPCWAPGSTRSSTMPSIARSSSSSSSASRLPPSASNRLRTAPDLDRRQRTDARDEAAPPPASPVSLVRAPAKAGEVWSMSRKLRSGHPGWRSIPHGSRKQNTAARFADGSSSAQADRAKTRACPAPALAPAPAPAAWAPSSSEGGARRKKGGQ